MDIVLGVSMTPTTVRLVLVEGEKADGITVDHDTFDVTSEGGSANVAEQVLAAVLGTKESAQASGHHLKSIGVTWSDHAEASALRDALAAHDIDDVMLVDEGHAAASLAQAVGRAVGYETTALLFVNRDTATLSVVQTDDGSVVKVLSRTLHSADAMAVLTEMAEAVAAQDAPPNGMFVVGSGVDVSSVKAHLEHLVSIPVNAPEDAELGLARGAALASAAAPAFEASTVGLAYSQDPDGTTAGSVYAGLAGSETQLAPVSAGTADDADEIVDEFAMTQARPVEEERKPFLLVGSALTSVFVIGVVALVISLAISIRPTADQRPSPAEAVIVPSSQVPAPAPVQQEAQPVLDPPSAETIKPPVPVVQQAPAQTPRTVFVEQAPAPAAPAPAPAPAAPPPAPAPAPAAPPPVVAPVVVPPPVIVLPQRQWPRWTPPKDSWTWPPSTPEAPQIPEEPEEEPESPWTPPWNPPVEPQVPQVPQAPQVPQVPQQPQWPQWPGSGSGSGGGSGSSGGSSSGSGSSSSGGSGSSGGSSSSGGSGRGSSSGSGDSGSSRGSSGSGVPGDVNGDGCFLIFCSPGGGRG